MRLPSLLVLSSVALWAEAAHAQVCSFDEVSGILSVNTQGGNSDLEVTTDGSIQLDGSPCGLATTSTTARIIVSGIGNDAERISLFGTFAPGRSDVPESDTPEIEIEVDYTDVNDSLVVYGDATAQVWRFTRNGINLNGDFDEDITLDTSLPLRGTVRLHGQGGNDVIDASEYRGPWTLTLYGGGGSDVLTGSRRDDTLFGNGGNDTLDGGAGRDTINDGTGADTVMGGPDYDLLTTAAVADPGDDFHGGTGVDTLSYSTRQNAVTVIMDNLANDGESGENDRVRFDIEGLEGGVGNDVLAASDYDYMALHGGDGNDMLFGGDGRDFLFGEGGDDVLYGNAGDDYLDGGNGNDFLQGDAGADSLLGSDGDDVIRNADGVADDVRCGAGVDDPEPDPLDTFIDCENI